MLNRGFWERAIKEDATWDTIKLSVVSLIGADFAAGAILISLSAMLGRVTASQLLVMATLEVIVYSINEMILVERFHVADIAGAMIIRAEHRGPGLEGERAVPRLCRASMGRGRNPPRFFEHAPSRPLRTPPVPTTESPFASFPMAPSVPRDTHSRQGRCRPQGGTELAMHC